MAREIMCDLCHQEVAEAMYSQLTDGTTVGIGRACAPAFALGLAESVGALDVLVATMAGQGTDEPGGAVTDAHEAPDDGFARPARRRKAAATTE